MANEFYRRATEDEIAERMIISSRQSISNTFKKYANDIEMQEKLSKSLKRQK